MRIPLFIRRYTPGQFVIHAVLAFALVIYGLPLLWLFIASTRTESSMYSDPPLMLGSWHALKQAWDNLAGYNDFQMLVWAKNSIIYTLGSVSLTLASCIPAGYVLAIANVPGRRFILIMTLVAMITPSQAIVLPIFLEMTLLGLVNTYFGLIIASAFFPFGVYLSYIYFTTSMPLSVIESARIDGCGHFKTFFRIALPMSKPLIALVSFFSFVNNWNNYFLAFVLISDDSKLNLPVGLTALLSSTGAINPRTASNIPIGLQEAILAAIIVVLPIILIFLASQKHVRSGLNAGAEKG